MITACVTVSPKKASASSFNLRNTKLEIWLGENSSPCTFTQASPFFAPISSNGTRSAKSLVDLSLNRRPISRLIANKVFSGLVTACRLAGCPTRRSPSAKAIIDGVVRAPSAFSITRGSDPSITATQEFVVPKSIPITFAIILAPFPDHRQCVTLRRLAPNTLLPRLSAPAHNGKFPISSVHIGHYVFVTRG